MHIAIDVRPLQLDAYRERGIGIHLRSWIEAAQALNSSSSYSLLYDPNLPRPRIRLASSKWQLLALDLPFGQKSYPSTVRHIDPDEEFVFDSALEAFLLQQSVDVFYESYTFMPEVFVARRLFKVKWVVMIYDLIPIVFKSHYLADSDGREAFSYAQRLGSAVYAQRVQTLSMASKKDIVDITGVPSSKVDVVYGGVDESFVPLPDDEISSNLSDMGIAPPFFFSVSGVHHTKNLHRLLRAYALLPSTIQNTYQLVIRCPIALRDEAMIDNWLDQLGIKGHVTFLQQVNKTKLMTLYNGASLVLHTTLYEGLGLPVLEAMRCGTPVITSNTASLPEISAGAAELVDPYDPSAIASKIVDVLANPDLQRKMIKHGLQRANTYTWTRTARDILDSLEKTSRVPHYELSRVFPNSSNNGHNRRLHLAFWSPINPCRSGISDYSEQLLVELGKLADVDIFVDGYQGANLPFFDSFPTFDGRTYPYLDSKHSYDMNIYQIGNNPLHKYMYEPVFKWPGIITLHDFYLYHFIHAAIMLEGNAEEFWKEVAFCEGPSAARVARANYLKGELDDYSLPLNKRLVLNSTGVVVHNEWAYHRVTSYEKVPPTRTIPMGLFDLPDDGGRFGRIVRRLLDIPEEAFVFGIFGNLHRVKRISVVLSAFARIRERYPEAILLIMGRCDVSVSDLVLPLQQDPEESRHRGIYLKLAYVPYDFMLMAMQAVDVGVNLRHPTVGETSASLTNLLGQRKPTIVSDTGSYREYPDLCCPKIPVNANEEDALVRTMRIFIENQSYYRNAVRAADDFVQGRTWAACAGRYVEFVENLL